MRLSSWLVVALVGVGLLGYGMAPASAAKKHGGNPLPAGYDLSYPQCGITYPSGQAFGVVGVTGGTSTPIEDLRDVAVRIYELAGTDEAGAEAADRAEQALDAAATPAGRTTSLPNPPKTIAGAA